MYTVYDWGCFYVKFSPVDGFDAIILFYFPIIWSFVVAQANKVIGGFFNLFMKFCNLQICSDCLISNLVMIFCLSITA